jgi:GNAT superfamily N-acetyltransferase
MEAARTRMTSRGGDVTIRRATASDVPEVLGLLTSSLGWRSDERHTEFFAWKHELNPFGRSPAWVALDGDGHVVGLRTFLRWEFLRGSKVVRAVRAVDTATRPDFQRRGVFSRLTRTAIEALRGEGVAFIFNTPNRQSLPGYMRMGWQKVGRLPVGGRARSLGGWTRLIRARGPADRWSLHSLGGVSASCALADRAPVERLLASMSDTGLMHTRLSVDYLRWRYCLPTLGYRILARGVTIEDGAVVFRLRRRGRAVEAVISDLLVPGDRQKLRGELSRRVLVEAGADYVLWIGGARAASASLKTPGWGPILTWRAVTDTTMPSLPHWSLSLGDVELL